MRFGLRPITEALSASPCNAGSDIRVIEGGVSGSNRVSSSGRVHDHDPVSLVLSVHHAANFNHSSSGSFTLARCIRKPPAFAYFAPITQPAKPLLFLAACASRWLPVAPVLLASGLALCCSASSAACRYFTACRRRGLFESFYRVSMSIVFNFAVGHESPKGDS